MNILYQGNNLIEDVVLTQSAEHEEELMKSDFIKLSWDDAEKMILPVGAYIEYKGIEYSLLEPYEPEQKSEAQWHYEPHFQHPKMYLSKVTFVRPTKDSDNEDITLLDWPYTGDVDTILDYFCKQINTALGLSGDYVFGFAKIGDFNQNIVSASFNTQDILSALTNVANVCKCEWHLDWGDSEGKGKTLFFGRISYLKAQIDGPTLKVDDNIGISSIRNSKEGYWNAFEPQGSTRNITKRAASGEYVQGNVRLSLRDYKVDEQHEHGIYPDGIVYTNGEGTIVTKEQFLALGEKPFIKSLIFEEVYPKLDLYAYNIRYRERYLLEDEDNPDSKVIDHYDDNGNPVYKRYAVWYMRLAWPEYADAEHTIVSQWHDYDISEVRDTSAGITIVQNPQGNYIEMDIDIDATQSWFTNESVSYPGTYIVQVKAHDITIKGYISGYYLDQGRVRFYAEYVSDTPEDDRDEPSLANLTAFKNAIQQTDTITFESGVDKKKFPKLYSQIIDGKQLYGQFKVNTRPNAESTPLAGRGDGDNGNYGFGLVYLGIEGQSYINEANREPTEEGDTGIVDMGGSRAVVTDKDYEIVFQQSDNFILPTTKDDLIIPKGHVEPSLYGNIVNLYNIVMDSSYTESAKGDLENETKKYITKSLEDDNQYTFKTNPVEWEQMFREDQTQNTDSHLFIGEKVYYVDGKTYTDENPLVTRVMKVVTKIDYDFEQEITIGNEVLKGAQTTLKEQVETLVSGGAGGTGGGGMSDSSVLRIVQNWVTPRFLSKTENDTAQGEIGFLKGIWIKAKGLFGFDSDGNIKANGINATGDAKIGGELDAQSGKIDSVQSHNYTGDGLADTGFRMIADDGTGSSSLVIDNVHIRKKLTAEELEVKKETAIAGNQVYSAAANIINRTDYFDANGKKLGYSDQRRPWLVKGMPLMLQGFFFGRVVETRIYLNPEDVSNIAYIRCYFLAKDDDTEVENMWMVGDLARCQSINIKNTKRNIYIKDYAPISNRQVFWWRKVVAVSSQPLHNDDDGKDYHWFDVSMSACASGSDIPAAGDHVVQFGNDIVTNRQNIITAEVSNNDSPALKFYHGINSFSLDNKRIIALRYNPETGRPIIEDYGDAFIGARDNSTYIKYDSLNKLLEVKARISAQSTIGNQLIDTYINKLITDITDDIQTQVDKKAETWYQQANPETNWYNPHATPPLDERSEHVGDLWYCTADNAGTAYKKNTTWYYEKNGNTYSWKQQNIPQSVFDTIDGKASIYITWNAWGDNLRVRDLYIPNADHTEGSGQSAITYKKDKVYRCTNASTPTFEEINYTDDTALTDFVNVTYSADQANLQNQIDGKYETWFYEGVPTLNNQPASQWTTESDKDAHVGDLYWDKTNKHAYRFVKNDNTYSWLQIGDEGVIAAMAQAAAAQDTADHKRRVFTSTPTTPYDVGDLWTEGPNGDIKKCKKARATGDYQASDWEKASKYTDDSALDTFKANQYVKALTNGEISQSITNADSAASAADSKARAAQAAAEAAASDASTAQSAAEAAQADANAANSKLNTWADDGVISPTEKLALKNQKTDVEKEYAQIINDAAKYTGVSTTAFTTAYNKAITAFNYYTASTPENIAIISDSQTDSDATPRYSRIADYYTARTTILNDIASSAKQYAADVAEEAARAAEQAAVENINSAYNYVRNALNSDTLIDGGLLLTSLIALRYNRGTAQNPDYITTGGINGYKGDGGAIAAWFGGPMVDGSAKIVLRHNGSGYLAGGNIKWDVNGNTEFNGSIKTEASGKGAWKIEPSLSGLLASPIISGIDKDGNDIVHFMFDGNPGDEYNVALGGGMYFTNGEAPNTSYYLREGWRVRSKNASSDGVDNGIIGDPGSDTTKEPRIAAYSNYKTIDYHSSVIEMGINAYSDGNRQGAYLYSNDWKTASRASNGETYVDAWGNLKVKTSQNIEQFNLATSDFSLPAGAPIGTMYFCKALSSPYYMTVSVTSSSWDTIISANSMDQNSSVEIGDNSAFFVKMTANKWVMFWSE